MAGRHTDQNANTLMRDPAWNRGRRACTAAMHSRDVQRLGLEDGQIVRVVTEAGRTEVELEVDDASRPGTVIIPHGFGLVYEGQEQGVNVNRLTKNTHRNPAAPLCALPGGGGLVAYLKFNPGEMSLWITRRQNSNYWSRIWRI